MASTTVSQSVGKGSNPLRRSNFWPKGDEGVINLHVTEMKRDMQPFV